MPSIFFFQIWENKDIVYIDDTKDVEKFLKDMVNKRLKNGWGISKPKGHYYIFKKAVMGLEGCKGLVALSNLNLIKPLLEV